MFDARFRKIFGSRLEAGGQALSHLPITPNQLSLAGLALAGVACLFIALEAYLMGLGFVVLSRLADGLDGPLARAREAKSEAKGKAKNAFGGYLDTVCDYGFYGGIPLAFAVARPENALPAALLLASFMGTASSFFGFALLAQELGLKTEAQGKKSFYYAAGLVEGGETIVFFVLFCLFPDYFALLATAFAVLCVITAVGRVVSARPLMDEPVNEPVNETVNETGSERESESEPKSDS